MTVRKSPDLTQLKTFAAVARVGSMTEAAKELRVTQSAVSQVLIQLERMFGVTLIDRAQRPLKVTGPGNILLRRAIPILDATDSLSVAVRELSMQQVPQLRLGCVDSLLASIGPHLFRSLLGKVHQLSVTGGTTGAQLRGLAKRDIDIALASDPFEGAEEVSRLPLLVEPFVLVVPANMRQAVDTPEDLGRLADRLPLVHFGPGSHMGMMTDAHLCRLGIRPSRSIEVDSSKALTAMVVGAAGWAISTPLCLLEVRAERRAIQVLPFPKPDFSRTLYVLARENEFAALPKAIAKAARCALRQNCLARLREYAPWAECAIPTLEEETS